MAMVVGRVVGTVAVEKVAVAKEEAAMEVVVLVGVARVVAARVAEVKEAVGMSCGTPRMVFVSTQRGR